MILDNVTNLTTNFTEYIVMNPGAIYTSWGEINKLVVVMIILGGFVGFGIGYHCYRLGVRFPWHKEK